MLPISRRRRRRRKRRRRRSRKRNIEGRRRKRSGKRSRRKRRKSKKRSKKKREKRRGERREVGKGVERGRGGGAGERKAVCCTPCGINWRSLLLLLLLLLLFYPLPKFQKRRQIASKGGRGECTIREREREKGGEIMPGKGKCEVFFLFGISLRVFLTALTVHVSRMALQWTLLFFFVKIPPPQICLYRAVYYRVL